MDYISKVKIKLHLSKKGKAVFAKKIDGQYMTRVDWDVFPYDCNVDYDECLPDTLGDTDSNVKITLKTFCNKCMDKIIFEHLNVNFVRK